MKLNILFLLFLISMTACNRTIFETIVKTDTGEVVAGYYNDCPLPLNKELTKKEITQEGFLRWFDKGLGLAFTYDNKAALANIKIGNQHYQTGRGLVLGDTIARVRELYGKPCAQYPIFLKIGEGESYMGSGMFYKNFTVYYDSTTNLVKTIEVGKNIDFRDYCRRCGRK